MPGGEEGVEETGIVVGSGAVVEGSRVGLAGVAASEGVDNVREEGSACVGEVGTEVGEDGREEGIGDGEGGKGEVMRGIGEDGWGE